MKFLTYCTIPSLLPLHHPHPGCSSFSSSPDVSSSSPPPSSSSPPLSSLSSSCPWEATNHFEEQKDVSPVVHEFAELIIVELVVPGEVESLEGSVHLLHTQVATELLELLLNIIISGTNTEFCIPDHWVQAAVMVKIWTFKLNLDLFRTTF